jgi:predicted 3-demethylubiquinone-9 3-methyltransferase (glyoxalase superfamily)
MPDCAGGSTVQKIIPYLWFDTQAEEAVHFYTSLFKNSKILEITRYGEGMPMPAGTVLTVAFELDGQQFVALNGGPQFQFTEAISLFVNCEAQAEVDELWAKFTEDGEESMCGWLKDKYGVSWQIIPDGLTDLLYSPDPEKSARAVQCMFTMRKIDLAKIRQAYEQG